MILSNIKNAESYYKLDSLIEKALKYAQENDLLNMPTGRHEIDSQIYMNIEEYNTKPIEQGKWEAHKKYIDIQLVLKGEEKLGRTETSELKESEPYNNEKDIMFSDRKNALGNFLNLKAGDFAIFYPHDAHMPQLSVDKAGHVKKAVIKVPLAS